MFRSSGRLRVGRATITRQRQVLGLLERKMKFTKLFALLIAMLLLVSCVTAMSARASHVQIISADVAKQYQFVANLSSSSSLTGIARQAGYQNALNDVLDKAASQGADFIVLDQRSGPSYWTTSEVVRATAYKRKVQ
jgi:hypothetical protein